VYTLTFIGPSFTFSPRKIRILHIIPTAFVVYSQVLQFITKKAEAISSAL